MSNLQCPACKQDIDGDSFFCDQCGEQIFICSACGRAGKGKRCIHDGKEMIPAGGSSSSATEHVSQTSNAPVTPQNINQVKQSPQNISQVQPSPQVQPAAGNKIKLSSQMHGIVIEAQEGDILGRTKGTFAAVLGRFSHISGSHCQITKTNGAWSVMDLGSTNGTFCNGSKLTPNSPVPLNSGSNLKLADVEFIVSPNVENAGTQRI